MINLLALSMLHPAPVPHDHGAAASSPSLFMLLAIGLMIAGLGLLLVRSVMNRQTNPTRG